MEQYNNAITTLLCEHIRKSLAIGLEETRTKIVILTLTVGPFWAMNTNTRLRLCLKCVFYTIAAYFTGPFFVNITIGVYENYFSSSISFNLDTLYLNWNTTFPSVTVCEIYNGEKVWDLSEEHFGEQHDLQIDDFVGEVIFFRGICSTCEKCEQSIDCPSNFTELLRVFRAKCSQLIVNCMYINNPFNCCEEFLPIRTEYGTCYSFNSIQAHKTAKVKYANNRATGPGHLSFEAITDLQLHVHPPVEIPYLHSEGMVRETVLLGNFKEIVVKVMEVHNDASVQDLSPEQRHCRFSWELTQIGKEFGLYSFYSYSTCIVECSLNIQLWYCNCTNHLVMDIINVNHTPVCDFNGLQCLTRHYNELQWERKSCDCLSSCDETEYNIIFNSADEYNRLNSEQTQILVSLMELPTERFLRRVTKNILDFIISVGGIVGLFLNASLLSVVELLFMLIEYRWGRLLTAWRAYLPPYLRFN